MTANSFGQKFVLHTFGESHGVAMGAIIDGCPAGLKFDETFLQSELNRRRPGQSEVVSQRNEADQAEVLSGVFEGKTLGTPIAVMIRNQDARSKDYDKIKTLSRVGHADDLWLEKFGHQDHRGGGRSSGRETVARVIGGAVAKMLLLQVAPNMHIMAYVDQIGEFRLTPKEENDFLNSNKSIDDYTLRFPSRQHDEVVEELKKAQAEGESFGGSIKIVVQNSPKGLGQPVFHKLKSDLAAAIMSVGATTGFEIGSGFAAIHEKGTDFHQKDQTVYGGIRGGISTGEDILLRVAFKPTSSILDIAKKGRHDPCIVTRALPVLESMIALVLADHVLLSRTDQV